MMFCKRGSSKVVIISADEIAMSIRAFLVARGVSVTGLSSVRIETPDDLTTECAVIVEPGGRLIDDEGNEVK